MNSFYRVTSETGDNERVARMSDLKPGDICFCMSEEGDEVLHNNTEKYSVFLQLLGRVENDRWMGSFLPVTEAFQAICEMQMRLEKRFPEKGKAWVLLDKLIQFYNPKTKWICSFDNFAEKQLTVFYEKQMEEPYKQQMHILLWCCRQNMARLDEKIKKELAEIHETAKE